MTLERFMADLKKSWEAAKKDMGLMIGDKSFGARRWNLFSQRRAPIVFRLCGLFFWRKLSVVLAGGLTLISLHCPAADFGVGSQPFNSP